MTNIFYKVKKKNMTSNFTACHVFQLLNKLSNTPQEPPWDISGSLRTTTSVYFSKATACLLYIFAKGKVLRSALFVAITPVHRQHSSNRKDVNQSVSSRLR
jgi:hypothetical protein